jgi:hypothetical protein
MHEDTEVGVAIISDDVLNHQIEINDQTEIGFVFGDLHKLAASFVFRTPGYNWSSKNHLSGLLKMHCPSAY